MGLDSLIVEVSRPHTIRHSQSVGHLWMSDQPVAEAATYTTNTREKLLCPQQDLNPQPQLASGRRPKP